MYDTVYRFILRTLSLVYLDKLSYDKLHGSRSPPYNPNVEAFTTGKISRYSPVYLIFNQEIPADRLKADRLGKLVRFKPDVPGKWAFENNRTLVFKPEKGFERNTSYQVKADLSEWFEAQGKDKWFAFGFTTLL